MSKSGCLGCEKRTVGCHSTCEDYLAETKKHAEAVEKIRKAKAEDMLWYDILKERKTQNLRKYKKAGA